MLKDYRTENALLIIETDEGEYKTKSWWATSAMIDKLDELIGKPVSITTAPGVHKGTGKTWAELGWFKDVELVESGESTHTISYARKDDKEDEVKEKTRFMEYVRVTTEFGKFSEEQVDAVHTAFLVQYGSMDRMIQEAYDTFDPSLNCEEFDISFQEFKALVWAIETDGGVYMANGKMREVNFARGRKEIYGAPSQPDRSVYASRGRSYYDGYNGYWSQLRAKVKTMYPGHTLDEETGELVAPPKIELLF